MTSGADPSLVEKLAQIRAAAEQRSEAIREEVRATEAEILEANRQTREENERLARELDEQAEQRRADNTGSSPGKGWNAPATSAPPERSFGFEDDRDFSDDVPQRSAPTTPPPPRHRRAAESDVDEDEDFSKTNWLS